jgi:hypothetical protein
MKRLPVKLTYANLVATLALFLALAGGTAVAATQILPKNSVGPKQLKTAAVTPAKLSSAAKATLTGPVGPKGATGDQGLKGDKGDQGDTGDTGPRGPSNAFYTFSNLEENESKAISISVPAGDYVASGSMLAVNASATVASEVECKLQSPGNANYGVTDITIPAHPSGTGITDTYTDPQAETALTVGAGGGVISFECFANGLTTIQLYQARIVATQVETLTTS